jgi:hypothetical protein
MCALRWSCCVIYMFFSVDIYCRLLDGWWCHLGRKWLQMLVLTIWFNHLVCLQVPKFTTCSEQVAQLSVTSNSSISVFWIRWVSFAAITLNITSGGCFCRISPVWFMTAMTGLKGQCIYIKSGFKLHKTLSQALETKCGFTVMI